MNGLEAVHAIASGQVPAPPIGELIGMTLCWLRQAVARAEVLDEVADLPLLR